ncbi:hypothetical protein lerEdw1_007189 [Lerista edwardsae]|nr:hypothetical protein lerEdw1_007189 [Lerista edwardsae]
MCSILENFGVDIELKMAILLNIFCFFLQNESKNVPMMVQAGSFNYTSIEDPPLQVLELPYKGNDLSMIIVLPKDTRDGTWSLEKLARCFSYEKIEEWTSSSDMHSENVEVQLPRFQLDESYDLRATLESMGMTLLFDSTKADLSGMSKKPGLVVSQVNHKSFVEVNEEGTEAAAGTGITGLGGGVPQIPVLFKADHPFFFMIKYVPRNTILFLGKCSKP